MTRRIPDLATFEEAWRATAHLPDASLSFPQVFGRRLAQSPSRTAFTVVKASGRELVARAFSHAHVDRAARRAAAELVACGTGPGSRVLVAVARPDELFSYLLACQALGAIAVPLPSVSEYGVAAAFEDRIRSVASDCDPAVVVVDSAAAWRAIAGDGRHHTLDASTVELAVPGRVDVQEYDLERDMRNVAFLQYTSGSCGKPKGVIVGHDNLVANFRAIAEGASFGPDDASFSWLPLFHDMGLVGGFLLGIYMGTRTHVMATRYFVQRPDAWLRAMSRYRATYTVAPNFAYSLAARRLPERATRGLDLSAWRLAFDGAEPIDRETVDAFIERFRPHGFRPEAFYPVYGLAECTLAAAFPAPGNSVRYDRVHRMELAEGRATVAHGSAREDALDVVSVGRAVPAHRVRILAFDSDRTLAERTVGEIAVSGPSVTRGYYGEPPRESDEVRTGDLGYLANGRLYVVDRIKDLIIVGGRNLAPADVEGAVSRVSGVVRGSIAAFGIANDGTEELCIVAAVDPRSWRTSDEIEHDVRNVVVAHFATALRDVVLVRPGAIPKTSSGKVRRSACKHLFETGGLERIDTASSRMRIKIAHLKRKVSGALAAGRPASDFPPAVEDSRTVDEIDTG